VHLQVFPQEKYPLESEPASEEDMQSASSLQAVQATFLDMSMSTTAEHLPHSVLELLKPQPLHTFKQPR
jgi:hypothetical protein